MVKHTQIEICRQIVSVYDHFMELALKGLNIILECIKNVAQSLENFAINILGVFQGHVKIISTGLLHNKNFAQLLHCHQTFKHFFADTML